MRVLLLATMLALLTIAVAPSAQAAMPSTALTTNDCEGDLVRFQIGGPCMTTEEAARPGVIEFYPCFRPGTFYAVILGKVHTGCIG